MTLAPLLRRGLTTDVPGDPVPPGPRMNPWHRAGAVVPLTGRLSELLLGLWQPVGFHLRQDGTPTGTARRPVPSAGGTYGVHTHLVVGSDGIDDLTPGRYVFDHQSLHLLTRDGAEWGAGDGATLPTTGLTLIFTVQPGRSFGRYRHRAWPLWIADTAYAWQAVEFLVRTSLPVTFGPGDQLRQLLGVAHASASQSWLSQGLAPEIPLVALKFPVAWTVDALRRQSLAERRSPAVDAFAAGGRHCPQVARVAALSQQDWVRYADRVETWTIPVTSPGLVDDLWRSHREAAARCYAAAASGRWEVRPVSGMPAVDGQWTVHALAMLDRQPRESIADGTS